MFDDISHLMQSLLLCQVSF